MGDGRAGRFDGFDGEDAVGPLAVAVGAGTPAGAVDDGEDPTPGPTSIPTSRGGSASGGGRLVLQWVLLGAPVLLLGVMGWVRRWMSDDGYIHLRVVQQLLAGNGPVFNAGERVEATTSPLWVFALAALKWSVLRFVELPWIAVGSGLAATVGASVVAVVAGRRLWRTVSGALLVPAGVLVVACLSPFWDYATSGLEVGLVLLWLASAWWALVALISRPDGSAVGVRRVWATGALFGLSWLVRPEMAMFAALFLAAAVAVDRGGPRRVVSWVAATAVVPAAFEVFRAGYYASLLPNTALAKDASGSAWRRGLTYVGDFVGPYRLWVPALALLVVAAFAARRLTVGGGRDRLVVAAAPVLGGALAVLYVCRVGGDWMHARMLLPPLFAASLPVVVVPLDVAAGDGGVPRPRWSALAAGACAVVVLWGFVAVLGLRNHAGTTIVTADGRTITLPASGAVIDQRRYHRMWGANTVSPGDFSYTPVQGAKARSDAKAGRLRLVVDRTLGMSAPLVLALGPDRRAPVWSLDAVGVFGYVAGPGVFVDDWLGLANPIGSRIPADPGIARPGHRKVLPVAWTVARFADPAAPPAPARGADVVAAREAMRCGDLAALLRRVDEPLTPRRFAANLFHALGTTRLRIPADPHEARARFCAAPGS